MAVETVLIDIKYLSSGDVKKNLIQEGKKVKKKSALVQQSKNIALNKGRGA
jgi:hypothetical protein